MQFILLSVPGEKVIAMIFGLVQWFGPQCFDNTSIISELNLYSMFSFQILIDHYICNSEPSDERIFISYDEALIAIIQCLHTKTMIFIIRNS